MKIIFDIDIPWVYTMKLLSLDTDENDLVIYNQFLERFRIDYLPIKADKTDNYLPKLFESWKSILTTRVYESLLYADLSLRETLMLLDRNCDGIVSAKEFREFLSRIDSGLSESQINGLLTYIIRKFPELTSNKSTDMNVHLKEDIKIDVAEFFGRFTKIYHKTNPK